MKKLLAVLIFILFPAFAFGGNLQLTCKDGFAPANEFQYKMSCTFYKNYSCCWQRWKKDPNKASGEMHFDCRGITPLECGKKISQKAIDWIIKNDPGNVAWIRADVAKYDKLFKLEPEPVEPPVEPVDPPAGDCQKCQQEIATCNDKLDRIQSIINE